MAFTEIIDIKSMTAEELSDYFSRKGQPSYRAKQVFRWLHSGAVNFDEMTNIAKELRQLLKEECYIANVKIVKRLVSKIDGTVKYLFSLNDGQTVETVVMKYNHGYSICISTQVGCRMGCSFCASGINGLYRNLTASEMLSQIMVAGSDLGVRISNVVMMGMGEPLDNFESSVRFLQLVSNDDGLNIGLRHISLSTSGVVSGIKRLAQYNFPITLSISLHAPFDELRSRLMPVNKRWKLKELIDACREYQNVTTRRISFEYALISGVNDSYECAKELARLLKGILCHVNLIPANPVVETGFKKPDNDKIDKFKNYLLGFGINTTVRRTLCEDINASCGQLRRKHNETEGKV